MLVAHTAVNQDKVETTSANARIEAYLNILKRREYVFRVAFSTHDSFFYDSGRLKSVLVQVQSILFIFLEAFLDRSSLGDVVTEFVANQRTIGMLCEGGNERMGPCV